MKADIGTAFRHLSGNISEQQAGERDQRTGLNTWRLGWNRVNSGEVHAPPGSVYSF